MSEDYSSHTRDILQLAIRTCLANGASTTEVIQWLADLRADMMRPKKSLKPLRSKSDHF